MLGALFWRRPTLARPIAVLPSGLQRFTAVFGMGTGGTTALLSPEFCAENPAQNSGELKISDCRLQIGPRPKSTSSFQRTRFQIFNLKSAIHNCWFSDIYIQDLGTRTLRLRFILRSLVSSVCRSACAERVNRKVKDQAERVISIT